MSDGAEAADLDEALKRIEQLFRARDRVSARALCEQVLARSPQQVDVLIWLGRIMMEDDLNGEAIALFDRALRIRVDPWTLGNLASCYCRTGQLAEAEYCLRGAITLKPDLVRAHVNLAAVLHGLRRFDEALAALAVAAEFNPDDHQIAARRGCTLIEQGKLDEGQEALVLAARLAGKFTYPRLVALDRATFDAVTEPLPAITPPELLHEATSRADYRYVVMISCDPAYMRKHGFPFIRSFARHAQRDTLLHVHLYDPDNLVVDEVRGVARETALPRLAISSDACPFAAADKQRRKSYYACGRLLHLPYWLDYYRRPVISLDVDIIIKDELTSLVEAASGFDFAFNRRVPIDSPWLDVIANIIVANPTALARRYLAAVGNYALRAIERESKAWLVDQTAMFCVLRMMERFGEPPAVAWISESDHPYLWHYGGHNVQAIHDPQYLKYAAPVEN